MSLVDSFRLVAENLQTTPEILITLLFTLAGFIFWAIDSKIGIMLHLVMHGVLFVWFYAQDMVWMYPLVLVLVDVVLLGFTLYSVQQTGTKRSIA